ncbi:hypothetical protein ABOM_008056 [Aspergillus bombycis]|uniref:beta-glucosidase n=1 Tax=Aspergillus bombycis TaxID=109264 RepID=A0A1F7ZWR3_9EURO|nr:hypothetical protein ABOM_008056 [Aspergillus bombycis]OGM43505.1 hypothetical protein ABOM_008056 [Aspergillus bombycis]
MLSMAKLFKSVAVLAMLGLSRSESNVADDTYFYGQSEPVYPSPIGTGNGDWQVAYGRAAALVAQMTLEEKNNLTYGVPAPNGCVGWIQPIPRLNFPGLCLQDAQNGVRITDFVNSYPSGIHVGARELAYKRAWHLGAEFKKKGVQVALGPAVGPLGRIPTGGRNWEGFSVDPYLAGAIGAETVKGTQRQGVITSVKHLIANEQERYRMPSISQANLSIEAVSSNVDDKTLHELYLWPFYDVLKAGAGNVMCSYQRINNSYACQNSKMMNGILKTELGFNGFVVSDWYGQHSGVASALAGLDMSMPYGASYDGESYWGSNFTEAISNGSVPVSRLDDMATRIIAAWYQMGQDRGSNPGVGMPSNLSEPHVVVNALDPAAKPVIFDSAVEGHVLVKNVKNALPLQAPRMISVFGYDAKSPNQNMPDTAPVTAWEVGYESALIQMANAYNNMKTPSFPSIYQAALNGTLSVGGGSGASSGPYLSSPLDALQQRAYEDNTMLMWDIDCSPSSTGLMSGSDACLVFINAFASEGWDRPGIHDDYSDELVNRVADHCANTVVVIHNAGIRLVDQFVHHPNVTAIIFAHLPGQDSGRALVSLLYGDNNFSGKLPYTVAKNDTDYPVLHHSEAVPPDGRFPQSNFTEGVYIDYRAFEAENITPQYEFGFGLSYTSFSFSDLSISNSPPHKSLAEYPSGAIEQGGAVDLWDTIATVTSTIHNTGPRSGAEVAQLYVRLPGGDFKQLRGFEKIQIAPGGSATVEFPLTRRDLSTWDVVAQKWLLQRGTYQVYVGSSSRNLPLTGSLRI